MVITVIDHTCNVMFGNCDGSDNSGRDCCFDPVCTSRTMDYSTNDLDTTKTYQDD